MTRPTGSEAEIERLRAELERTKSELHRPRGDGLSVGEHIALVQRAQGIAKTDHAELVRAQRELAAARAELKRLRRRAALRAGDQRAAGPRAEAGNATMTPWQERQAAMLDPTSQQRAEPAVRRAHQGAEDESAS